MVHYQTHTSGFAANVVAATAGKRIRVQRVILSTAINTQFTLKQDIGGASDAAIGPTFEGRAGAGPMDLRFRKEQPQTAPGVALGYESTGIGNYGVWIEYDLVA